MQTMGNVGEHTPVMLLMNGFKTPENHQKHSKNQLFPTSVLRLKNATFYHSDEGTCAIY